MYVHKGQIFDVMDSSSDWWLARLVRDVEPGSGRSFCEQGWVPGSFLDRYEGQLGKEEEAAIQAGLCVCLHAWFVRVFVCMVCVCVCVHGLCV